jgi:hypothetical protein
MTVEKDFQYEMEAALLKLAERIGWPEDAIRAKVSR